MVSLAYLPEYARLLWLRYACASRPLVARRRRPRCALHVVARRETRAVHGHLRSLQRAGGLVWRIAARLRQLHRCAGTRDTHAQWQGCSHALRGGARTLYPTRRDTRTHTCRLAAL